MSRQREIPKPPEGEREYDVVGFGLNAVDHLCTVPTFPKFSGKTLLDRYDCHPGGPVATALVALRRWGLRTAYLGSFGDDWAGLLVQESLRREGVALEGCLVREGVANQMAVIIVDAESGERTVLWHRDSRLAVGAGEVDPSRFLRGRLLHLDGADLEASVDAARRARRAGITTLADLDRAREGLAELLPWVDVAVVSREFSDELGGPDDPLETLSLLAESGCSVVGVTLGVDGAVARTRSGTVRVPAFPVRCLDTTGAGDVFHAGLGYGLLAGWSIERLLRFAAAAAALQCTRLGAHPAVPPLQEVVRLEATRGG